VAAFHGALLGDVGYYVCEQYETPTCEVLGDDPDEVTPDRIGNPAYGAYGYIHNPDGAAWAWKAESFFEWHDFHSEYVRSPSEEFIITELDCGYPVVASTKVTAGGHWVVIKGYTEPTWLGASHVRYYVVNDPFGAGPWSPRWLYESLVPGDEHGGYGNISGADVLYISHEMRVDQKFAVTAHPTASIVVDALNEEGVEIASIEGMDRKCVEIYDGNTGIGYGAQGEESHREAYCKPIVLGPASTRSRPSSTA